MALANNGDVEYLSLEQLKGASRTLFLLAVAGRGKCFTSV